MIPVAVDAGRFDQLDRQFLALPQEQRQPFALRCLVSPDPAERDFAHCHFRIASDFAIIDELVLTACERRRRRHPDYCVEIVQLLESIGLAPSEDVWQPFVTLFKTRNRSVREAAEKCLLAVGQFRCHVSPEAEALVAHFQRACRSLQAELSWSEPCECKLTP